MFESLDAMPIWVPIGLVVASLIAGLVDSIVGGGGLIQLPALLLVPGFQPVQALATNKVASACGTITSSITFARRVRPDWRMLAPVVVAAFAASFGGAVLAARLPAGIFTPIIVVVLVGVLIFTLMRPDLGSRPRDEVGSVSFAVLRGLALGLVLGFYDGLLGPGTGVFLVLGITLVLQADLLRAAGGAKIVNVATNLGALAYFIPLQAVHWPLAILLGAANLVGSYLGARLTMRLGARFVRWMLVIVVSALIVRLVLQLFGV
ncbi:MAG: sulfite exporter TauE/SafE family protein [Pseudoclavibacter sp.]